MLKGTCRNLHTPSASTETEDLRFPSRQGLTPRVHQESNPEIPVPPGDEHDVLDTSLDKVSFALQ